MPAPTTMTFLGVPAARGSSGSRGITAKAVPAVKARFRSVLWLSIFATHLVHRREVLLETQCNENGGRRGQHGPRPEGVSSSFSDLPGTEPDEGAIQRWSGSRPI